MKFLSIVLVLNLLGTFALASNDYFRCDRIAASSVGLRKEYQSQKGLEKVFPLELEIVIAKDKKWAASFYGVDEKRSINERKFDLMRFKHWEIHGEGLRSTGEIYVRNRPSAGLKNTIPAKYKCDRAIKTNWQPDF